MASGSQVWWSHFSRIDVSVDADVRFFRFGSDAMAFARPARQGTTTTTTTTPRARHRQRRLRPMRTGPRSRKTPSSPTRTVRSLTGRERNTTRVDAQPARPKPSMTDGASDCGAQENLGLRRQGTPDLLRDVRRDVWQRCNRRSQIRVPHPQKVKDYKGTEGTTTSERNTQASPGSGATSMVTVATLSHQRKRCSH